MQNNCDLNPKTVICRMNLHFLTWCESVVNYLINVDIDACINKLVLSIKEIRNNYKIPGLSECFEVNGFTPKK